MWVKRLQDFYTYHLNGPRWLLKMLMSDTPLIKLMLLTCPHEKVKEAYSQMISHALCSLAVHERHLYSSTQNKIMNGNTSYTKGYSYSLFYRNAFISAT